MPVQYYYPTNDNGGQLLASSAFVGIPNNSSASLYTNIDEGVETPNDLDYILGSGLPTNSSTFRAYNTTFDLSTLNINPVAIQFNIRYSGGVISSGSSSTSNIQLYNINNTSNFTQFLLPPNPGGFTNFKQDITSFLNFNNLNVCVTDNATYVPIGSGSLMIVPTPKFAVSALELMFSGSVIFKQPGPTLFIYGSQPTGNIFPLYVNGFSPFSGACDLFLQAKGINNTCDLFLKAFNINTNTNLFLQSNNTNTGLNLFTKVVEPILSSGNTSLILKTNSVTASGNQSANLFLLGNNLKNSGNMNLFIGAPISGAVNTNIPLFLNTQTPTFIDVFNANNGIISTLFIQNNFGSGNASTNLIVTNVNTLSGTLPIYLNSKGLGSGNLNTSLFLNQRDNITSLSNQNTSLFINQNINFTNNSMNLFIQNSGTSLNNNSTLFTYAITQNIVDGNSVFLTDPNNQFLLDSNNEFLLGPVTSASSGTTYGLFNSTPMFINGSAMNNSINLFIGSIPNFKQSGSLGLFVDNNTKLNGSVSLTLNNSGKTINNGIPLRIRGAGQNNGFFVGNSSASLFLARNFAGVYNGIPLFLDGVTGINSSTSLMVSGGTYLQNNTTLVMPGTKGIPSGVTKIYINGF